MKLNYSDINLADWMSSLVIIGGQVVAVLLENIHAILMNIGHLTCFAFLQKPPSRYSLVKSTKVVEPADLYHDEFMKVKSAPMKIVRSSNKRGRVSRGKGRIKKLSKRMNYSKRDTGHRNVKVTENLSQRIKQQGQGSHGQAGGHGRRTVRKRRVEKRAVEDLLLGHRAATHSSNIGREPLRILDEDWNDEKASPMTPIQTGAADIGDSAEEVESDDNAQAVESDDNVQAVESDDNVQAVEYGQGNWEIGFNGTPNRWSRDMVGMSDEDVEASEDDNDNGIEENEEEEDSEADVMSEGSDGMANRVVSEESSDSAVSEDSSD